VIKARQVISWIGVRELGCTGTEVARYLGVTNSFVTRIVTPDSKPEIGNLLENLSTLSTNVPLERFLLEGACMPIREAVPDDFDTIIAIFESWRPENYDTGYAVRYYTDYFGDKHFTLEDQVFIYENAEQVAGVVGYCLDDYGTDGIYWMNWFYVHHNHLGQGIGRALVEYVIEAVQGLGARKLYVDTSSFRFYQAAMDLYQDRGFIEEGRLQDYYGNGEDQVIFGRRLYVCD